MLNCGANMTTGFMAVSSSTVHLQQNTPTHTLCSSVDIVWWSLCILHVMRAVAPLLIHITRHSVKVQPRLRCHYSPCVPETDRWCCLFPQWWIISLRECELHETETDVTEFWSSCFLRDLSTPKSQSGQMKNDAAERDDHNQFELHVQQMCKNLSSACHHRDTANNKWAIISPVRLVMTVAKWQRCYLGNPMLSP